MARTAGSTENPAGSGVRILEAAHAGDILSGMATLTEVQWQADQLSPEDKEGLISYLLHGLPGVPSGIDDAEVCRREQEMDRGEIGTLSHDEFLQQVGRKMP